MKLISCLLIACLGLISVSLATYSTPWTLLKPSGRTPAARMLHASIYNNGVWIYGGVNNHTSNDAGLQVFCDLQHYDDLSNTWTQVDNCSRSDYIGPGLRYDTAHAQWKDCFLIFGGTNDKGARTIDTWCYNFTSGHWSELAVKFDTNVYKTDLEQTGLSAVVYEDNFVISSNQQIFTLNLTAEPKIWSRMDSSSDAIHLVGANNYAMTLEESTGKVWMYAGLGQNGEVMRWVNWIMTSNWTYETPIILAGLSPLSRSKSAFSDGGEYFLWGGYNPEKVTFGPVHRYPNTTYKFINDSISGLIWAAAPATNNPRGRAGHSLVKGVSNELFVFGGRTEYEASGFVITYDELWTVSMATQISLDVTTVHCTEPSSFVDEPYQCLINGKDVDGRVTGDSAMAKNFKIVVTGNDNSTISATSVMYFGSVFHFAFRVNTTGQYKVTITYLDAELPKGPLFIDASCPSMYWGSTCSVNGWWIIGPAIAVVVVVAIIVTVVVVRKRKAGYQPLN
jgi:hypothetical protein